MSKYIHNQIANWR